MNFSFIFIVSSKYAENADDPDIQFYFGGFLADCAVSGQVGELSSNYSRSIQIFPAVLHPKSRGYITLNSKNPFDAPKIFANYLDEEHDIKVLVEGIRFALKLAETSPLKAYGMELDTSPVDGCKQHQHGTQVKISLLRSVANFIAIFLCRLIGNVQFARTLELRTIKLEVVRWDHRGIHFLLLTTSLKFMELRT